MRKPVIHIVPILNSFVLEKPISDDAPLQVLFAKPLS